MTTSTSSSDPAGARAGTPAAAPALLLAAALVAGACATGGAGRAPARTVPVASLSDAVACVRERGKKMGFEVARYDEETHLLVLEREDEDVQVSDPKFQRAVDQLRLEAAEGEPGADRGLTVTARTFYEYFTRRGRTRRQREASDGAVAAADTLIERCTAAGGGTGPDA